MRKINIKDFNQFINEGLSYDKELGRIKQAGETMDRAYASYHPTSTDSVNYLETPIMGKTIKDVKYISKKRQSFQKTYTVTKGNDIYILWDVDFKHTSSTHYIITVNDIIVYHKFSNILAPASDAFSVLSRSFITSKNGSWVIKSPDDITFTTNYYSGDRKEKVQKISEEEFETFIDSKYRHY